mgnify:CR=1 FL=1|jgi:mannose-P-dolichol utilization defect protein 1
MSAPPLPCARLSVSTPLELLDPPCLKYAVSKTLGYGIVVGSAGVKLPQLLAIYRAGGVTGLSGSSIVIEMASCACSFAYFMALGYPFSTWGENFFLFFGQAVITAFYYHFTSGLLGARSIGTFVPLAALGIVLYKRMVPDIVVPPALCALLRLPSCTITCEQLAGTLPMILMLFGRLPQIVQNIKQGHTGQLSLITYCLNVAGSGARVFTVMQELDDKIVLASATSAFLQNLVLCAQILMLGGPPATKPKDTKKKKK